MGWGGGPPGLTTVATRPPIKAHRSGTILCSQRVIFVFFSFSAFSRQRLASRDADEPIGSPFWPIRTDGHLGQVHFCLNKSGARPDWGLIRIPGGGRRARISLRPLAKPRPPSSCSTLLLVACIRRPVKSFVRLLVSRPFVCRTR